MQIIYTIFYVYLYFFVLYKARYKILNTLMTYTFPGFAESFGIRARWGIEINGRFEAERPPVSAGPSSGGRAATLIPLSPMYSTRPCCLVQAIIWHLCPDPDLGS